MPAKQDIDAQLDRAYVQSKVIKTNLDHLGDTLSAVAPDLLDDLAVFSSRFDDYVYRLGAASTHRLSGASHRGV